MTDKTAQQPSTNPLDTASDYLVGGGIITMALFPLALPLVALLIVAVLPLVVVAIALGLIGAVLAAPVILIRSLSRRLAPMRAARREDHVFRGNRPVMGARG